MTTLRPVKQRSEPRPCRDCTRPTWSAAQRCVRCTRLLGPLAADASPADFDPPLRASYLLASTCFFGGAHCLPLVALLVAGVPFEYFPTALAGITIVSALLTLSAALAFLVTPPVALAAQGRLNWMLFGLGVVVPFCALLASGPLGLLGLPMPIAYLGSLLVPFALVVVAGRIFARGLNRAHPRGCCRSCGYRLPTGAAVTCPECGFNSTAT